MDSEEVIYIIIFAVIFVFNVIKNARKAVSQTEAKQRKSAETTRDIFRETSESPREVFPDFGKTDREIFQERPDEHPYMESENTRDVRTEWEEPEEYEDEYEEEYKDEPVRDEKEEKLRELLKKAEQISNQKQNQAATSSASSFVEGEPVIVNVKDRKEPKTQVVANEEAPIKLNIDDADEVRRAFVYSEILNRKY
ncbi:MAG: hypothetical protein IJ916_01660 [Paludibacteraceae bacterium]|nr:hypothetical protein [Paludibacteraceae bacterium]